MCLAGTHSKTNNLRSDLETLKNIKNDSNLKISKSTKLRTKYKIICPGEIQTVLEKINNSSKICKVKTVSKTISLLQR